MVLEDYRANIERCSRCSYCKWIPFAHMKSWRFAKGCPSIEYNKFQAFSACGRLTIALSLLEKRFSYADSEGLLDIVYKCMMDGMCDISDKICRYNVEPLEIMRELRFKLVEDGQLLPQHTLLIDNLRKEDNMLAKPRGERGNWAQGLVVKDLTREPAEIVFHAGCRYSFDEGLWGAARTAVNLIRGAGIDVGILGKDETCCGCRAYDMGYRGEFTKYAENNIETWKTAGVKAVVTSCADCYYAFKRLYPELDSRVRVFHTVEFLDHLIKEKKIRFTRKAPMKVTYHDPCHLGRLGERYVPWQGMEKKIYGQIVTYDPPKPRYTGASGVYEPPRSILHSIPGLELVEMERRREYSWCCGAGGGVKESYPEFSSWTANERIEEAKSTGAEAIVTACPWCIRNFKDALSTGSHKMDVYDIAEMVKQAL